MADFTDSTLNFRHGFGICRSFMVPQGTNMKVYKPLDEYWTNESEDYVTLYGSSPISDYGLLPC